MENIIVIMLLVILAESSYLVAVNTKKTITQKRNSTDFCRYISID